jgi:hypothetical protein
LFYWAERRQLNLQDKIAKGDRFNRRWNLMYRPICLPSIELYDDIRKLGIGLTVAKITLYNSNQCYGIAFIEELTVVNLIRKLLTVIGAGMFITALHNISTGLCPGPIQLSLALLTYYISKGHTNTQFPSTPASFKWSLQLRFHKRFAYPFFHFPTCPLPDLTTLTTPR